jgi:CubicO group peptidase (beta-lactamase class C family)
LNICFIFAAVLKKQDNNMKYIDELTYLTRYVIWNQSNTSDYKKFVSLAVPKSNTFRSINKAEDIPVDLEKYFSDVSYKNRTSELHAPLERILIDSASCSFIIYKDDKIIYEKYFNGYGRDSINTSFSTAKSFTSVLIGIAIKDGLIDSVSDALIDYIPELKSRVSNELRLENLLAMNSGLRYNSSLAPWADEPKSYYYPNIRKLILSSVRQDSEPGRYFKYVNYNYSLLGLILERVCGKSPAEYLSDKIWKPLGMEFSASWSVDSAKHKFAKMESGINGRSIDYLRFGLSMLNNGIVDDNEIIGSDWIDLITSPWRNKRHDDYYTHSNFYPYSLFFKEKRLYYKLGWWGLDHGNGEYEYCAIGRMGQLIFINPSKKIVIVRNGSKWGNINYWPSFLSGLVRNIK